MLNCPTEFLQQMSGDKDAGFFRRAAWIDNAISPPKPGKWRRVMEVYSWGGLTSRRASRALWLLLLPFTLINLAHWMLPPAAKGRHRSAKLVVTLLRLLALSFTLTLLLAGAMAVLDVAVWQCASLDYCSSGLGPLAFLERRSPGFRLALGAIPLAAVIWVLWFLGRGDMSPGVLAEEEKKKPPEPVVTRGAKSPLAHQTFWNPDKAVRRMRSCHVTVWTTGLAALVLAVPFKYALSPVTRAGTIGLLLVNIVIFAIAVIATASTRATGRGGPSNDKKLGWLIRLRWYATGALVASLIWVALRFDVPYPKPPTSLPWIQVATLVLLALQAGMLVMIFLGTVWSMRPKRGEPKATPPPADYGMSLGGCTAPAVALLGWLIGGGLSVGVGLWTAQTLGMLVYATPRADRIVREREAILAGAGDFDAKVHQVSAEAPMIVPPPYVWAAIATLVMVVVVLVVGLALWWFAFRKGRNEIGKRLEPSTETIERRAPKELQDRIATNRALASLTNLAPLVIGWLALATVAVFIAVVVLFFYGQGPLGDLLRGTNGIANISFFILVAIVVGLVLLVVQAVRNRQVRRVVGILWDVATFWPRANHPLTPPSYGGRTVWDLRVRLRQLNYTRDDADGLEDSGRVVLVAHSQGTIIAAATLLQAADDDEQYPLLTFGSPLRRLYACNFPAYFGYETMTALRDRKADPAHRWINLWSYTDPIGGNVFDDKLLYELDGQNGRTMADSLPVVDCRILDVQQQDPDNGDYAICKTGHICGHSGFWLRNEYVKAVDVLQVIVTDEDERKVVTEPPDSSATERPKADAV